MNNKETNENMHSDSIRAMFYEKISKKTKTKDKAYK